MTTRPRFFPACLLVLSAALVHAGAAQAASVGVGASNTQGSPGQEVEIPITLKGATDLGALELVLLYDPAILEFKEVQQGPLLTGGPVLEFKSGDPGRLAIVMATLESVQGDGVVFKVRFVVRGQAGQKSPLKIEDARAWEGKTLLEMLVTPEEGEFTVVRAPLPWWLIALGVAALLAMLLVVWALMRWRRRSRVKPTTDPASVQSPEVEKPSVAVEPSGLPTFKHHCNKCNCVMQLPQTMLGKQVTCPACGLTQIGGQ